MSNPRKQPARGPLRPPLQSSPVPSVRLPLVGKPKSVPKIFN